MIRKYSNIFKIIISVFFGLLIAGCVSLPQKSTSLTKQNEVPHNNRGAYLKKIIASGQSIRLLVIVTPDMIHYHSDEPVQNLAEY